MIIFLLSCCIPLLMHYSCNISHCRWLMPRNRYSYFHHRINLCKNHLRKYLWMKIAVYGGWLESWFLEQLDLCKLFGYSKLRAYLTFPNHLSRTKKRKSINVKKVMTIHFLNLSIIIFQWHIQIKETPVLFLKIQFHIPLILSHSSIQNAYSMRITVTMLILTIQLVLKICFINI